MFGVVGHLSTTSEQGMNSSQVPFPSQNKGSCRLVLHGVPLMPDIKQRESYRLIPFLRSFVYLDLELNHESTAPEANALSTRPSDRPNSLLDVQR